MKNILIDKTFAGLNDKEVVDNRKKYGTNQISKVKSEGFFQLLIASLGDPIIRILVIALGIKLVFLIKDFDWYETVGIVIAIFVASFISTISEYGSEKAFEKLQEESSKIKCRVKRNGKIVEISIDDIVVDDIVVLESGDKIPADGKIIKGRVGVDESSLNGETKEIYKDVFGKVENTILYRGSVVCSGTGLMLVERTGDNSFYGKLAQEIQEKQPDSPLKIRLRNLAKIISYIGYAGAVLVSLSYLFSVVVINNNFIWSRIVETLANGPLMLGYILYALTLSVTIIVVAVPEGLPMMITLVLSSNMKRMLKNNVLVRKMVGIETAGSLNILFTDKTGTLTKGKMDVIKVLTGDLKEFDSNSDIKKHKNYYEIFRNSIIYNNASSYDINKKQVIGGNITDKALLKFSLDDYKKDLELIDEKPFDSRNKYSKVTIKLDNGQTQTLIKGAPEKLLPSCRYYYDINGNKKALLSIFRLQKRLDEYTKKGIRVLVLAVASGNDESLKNLILVGVVLIKDEVRPEIKKGLIEVNQAGIQVVMITGDNCETALAIGEEIGLIKDDRDIVLTSEQLNKLSDDELKEILPNLRIVARSLPQDKSRLVAIAQSLNKVVGMTGDGVNDAPALKRADVGFAMGSGTEVAKEASDIVILDNNFISISKAILFGRTIFKSIRKFIIFQLTVNLCAVSLSIIGPFIGVDTPVTVIQMLWINMVMDTLAGLAFSFEPPLKEYMKEKPKQKEENIINKYMWHEIIFTGIYSAILCILFLKVPLIKNMFRPGLDNEYLMTAFFGLFIFMSIFNSFNARTHRLNLLAHIFKNPVFIITIIFIIIVQIFLIYYGGSLFRTSGLTFQEFQVMLLLAMSVIPVDWVRKFFLRKKGIIGGV